MPGLRASLNNNAGVKPWKELHEKTSAKKLCWCLAPLVLWLGIAFRGRLLYLLPARGKVLCSCVSAWPYHCSSRIRGWSRGLTCLVAVYKPQDYEAACDPGHHYGPAQLALAICIGICPACPTSSYGNWLTPLCRAMRVVAFFWNSVR